MTAYLWHTALGAGGGTRELRSAVPDDVLAEGGAHITRALSTSAGDPIPGKEDYAMSATSVGGSLLCFVGRREVAIATFAVATSSRHARRVWISLHEGYPWFAESKGDVPRAPYCAVRAEVGLIADPSSGDWLDGYQIAIAWAWVENRALIEAAP